MAKHDFLQLFGTLNKKELSEFDKYLRTANKRRQTVLQVFKHCKRYYPSLDFDVEAAARRLFPDEMASLPPRKALLNVFSELYAILKGFLLLKKLADDSLESRLIWLKVQKERELKAEFEKGAYRLMEEVRASPKKGEADYLRAMLAEYALVNGFVERTPPSDEMVGRYSTALENFMQIARLKVACDAINRANLRGNIRLSLPYNSNDTGQMLCLLYQKVQSLLLGSDEKDFEELEEMLASNAAVIDKQELQEICKYLKNHCTKMFRTGNKGYGRRAHNLDIFGLANQLYIENGIMPMDSYFNIISVATAVGEMQWAEDFTKKYKSKLDDSHRYEAWMLASAILLYEKKEYDKALKKLGALEDPRPNSIHLVLRCRLLKVACLAGMDMQSDQLTTELINAGNFLKRHRSVLGAAAKASNNFLNIVNLMVKRKKPTAIIEEEIKAAKGSLFYEAWLLGMLNSYRPC